jgi:CIC family chloride channel protein
MATQTNVVGLPHSTSRGRRLRAQPHEDKVLMILTLIIGAVVGLVVVLFIVLTERLGSRFYPEGSPAWHRVLIPVLGAGITGFLLQRYFPEARGSGIPQTKTALFLRDGYIGFRTVLGKFGLCSASLASGIALGREGPSVHVGAGIASELGRRLRLSAAATRALIPIGASAALAAAFNTPISAVLFSLEEVMGDMHAPVLGSVVLSSATSWIVLHLVLGDEPLFHVPAYQLVHPIEFVFYAALGVVGGLVSASFVKLLLWERKHFLRVPRRIQWLLPAVGGLTVGLLAWRYPEVLGVGYAYVGKALNTQMLLSAMAILVVLKLVATATCYASGNAGGIFGPSLFIGAMMGGAVGGVAHLAMPDYTASVGAYALVGMGAAFAGIVRVPLTSVIMIFEITRDYSIIVPLMIANLISYFISSRLQEEPIYEALLHQDGMNLPAGARARESLLTIGDACRSELDARPANELVREALAAADQGAEAVAVLDGSEYRGMVTREELLRGAQNGDGHLTLRDVIATRAAAVSDAELTPRLHPDDPLELALRSLADGRVKVLPVVSRSNLRELIGTISLSDVMSAYARTDGFDEPQEPSAGASRMRLLVGVLAAVVGVAVLGGFLNYFYRAERIRKADQAFATANDLFQKDRLSEAIDEYRSALSISHTFSHRLALALALVKADRMNEAAIYLNEILREQPNNGPANLAMAHVLASQGRVDEAAVRYHRAILGTWPNHPEESKTHARLELIDLLKKSGKLPQARAELLALAADVPADPAIEKQAGRMLIDSGLLHEARDLFQSLLKRVPPDAAEYDGLADTYFASGDYRSAENAYRKALQIDAADQTAAARAGLCERILALDPTQRGISSKERFRRSQELLQLVADRYVACSPAPITAEAADAIAAARAELARRKPPRYFADAADADVELAERLWAALPTSCQSRPADQTTRLVLSKLKGQ